MSQKKFLLRINEKLMQEIEKWATEEFRSTNGQIEFLLTQAVRKRKKNLPDSSES